MIEIWKVILFGIVEGITEWLPISSTGHLILLDEFIKLNVSTEFYNVFQVVIQLGAIMAVIVLFWKELNPFENVNNCQFHKMSLTLNKNKMLLWFHIIIACLPAAIVGLLFDDQIESLFYNYQCVAVALIVFGIAFIVVENKKYHERIHSLDDMTIQTAFIIGIFQLIAAIFPGTSRSGATILGALLLGVSRTVATEFTFFLAVPVMFGASLLKMIKFGFVLTMHEVIILLIGIMTSFGVSLFVIHFLMEYIKKHNFKSFGWYRIVLGIVVFIYFLLYS